MPADEITLRQKAGVVRDDLRFLQAQAPLTPDEWQALQDARDVATNIQRGVSGNRIEQERPARGGDA